MIAAPLNQLEIGSRRDQVQPDGDGTLVKRFVDASHATIPDFMVQAGATYRLVADHLSSVRLVLNVANSVDAPLQATSTSSAA